MTKTIRLRLGPCEFGCALCRSERMSAEELERALASATERVEIVGVAGRAGILDRLAARPRPVTVHTHAVDVRQPEAARAFARRAQTALVPFFSSSPAVHDRITGRAGSLSASLVGIRSLADAGVAIEAEIPILAARLQDLEALVALLHRALPSLAGVRFLWPGDSVASVLRSEGWSTDAERLRRAVASAQAVGLRATALVDDGIPLCVLGHDEALRGAIGFDPKRRARRQERVEHRPGCETCAARRECPGTSKDATPRPFERKPVELYTQRTPGAPKFTLEHKRLAGRARTLVLRPTVHCNQDCTFCSANETSNNVWEDPDAMLRAIVRAAGRGVRRISFGGGEPTLSRDLVHFVSAAHRMGVPQIELVTNAVLLDKPAKVEALRAAGLTDAFVSLHAHDEALSQRMTRKIGDHARTLAGCRNLLAAGIPVVLNHVITSQNYPYLLRFVETAHRELDGKVGISFAFVTPQFKALEDISQVPRISDVAPYLRRAIHRAIELAQPVHVGSRQGIPPCLLGELRAWSDVLLMGTEPAAEDAPQKQRAPGCDGCRYTRQCQGLWKPYVARYGVSELRPIPGPAFTDEEVAAIVTHPRGWTAEAPKTFEHVSPLVRDLEGEAAARIWLASAEAVPQPLRALPVLPSNRSRPLRTLLLGTGRQARRLAREAAAVPGLAFEAIASPHAHDAALAEFGNTPRFSSLDEALAEMRPEAVVVAASTTAHHALATRALEAGLPVLVEKPLARTESEASELATRAAVPGARLLVAYQTIFSSGMARVLDDRTRPHVEVRRRSTAASGEAMSGWSREALGETLEHAVSLLLAALGPGEPSELVTTFRGARAPETISISLRVDAAQGRLELDFDAPSEGLRVVRRGPGLPELAWERRGPEITLREGDRLLPFERRGSDLVRLLEHFREVALGLAAPRADAALGLGTHRLVKAVLTSLEAAGAPFEREGAPRHASAASFSAFARRS